MFSVDFGLLFFSVFFFYFFVFDFSTFIPFLVFTFITFLLSYRWKMKYYGNLSEQKFKIFMVLIQLD